MSDYRRPVAEETAAPRPRRRPVAGEAPQTHAPAPRPASLNRIQQQARSDRQVRRPVDAPGFTRQPPVSSAYIRESEPQQQPRQPAAAHRGNPVLSVLLSLVLCFGLVVFSFLLLPNGTGGALGEIKTAFADTLSGILIGERRETAALLDFSCANATAEAPAEIVFTLTTTKAVQAVRIVDAYDNVLKVSYAPTSDNTASRVWVMTVMQNGVYAASVHSELLSGREWLRMDKVINLNITLPEAIASAEAIVVPTVAPPQNAAAETPEESAVPAEGTEEKTAQSPELTAPESQKADGAGEAYVSPAETAAAAESEAEAAAEDEAADGAEDVAEVEAETEAEEAPIITPEPTETPEPTATPEPTPTPTPEPTSVPTEIPTFNANPDAQADPELLNITEDVFDGASKKSSYRRADSAVIRMPAGAAYASYAKGDYYENIQNGVLTFRGNAFRENAAAGTVSNVSGLQVKWRVDTGSITGTNRSYYGTEFGSQPAIVKWSKEVREASNITDEKKSVPALKEVIAAGADGVIRFLDLSDGSQTRSPISIKYPITASVSVHPSGYPLMAVGQATRKVKGGKEIGLRVYDLLTQKNIHMIDGTDGKLKRPFNTNAYAFNTTPLIDPRSDTMITIGANGLLYTTALNAEFDRNVGVLSTKISTIAMRSKTARQKGAGISVESSPAAYLNFVYYADASGVLHCVDTTTMSTVWLAKTGDKVQASVALDFDEEGTLWVYAANTLQNRNKGDCTVYRFNAQTGAQDWSYSYGTRKVKKSDAVPGAMASPVVGRHEIEDYIIYTVSGLKDESGIANLEPGAAGAVVALRKKDGSVAWSRALDTYAHSSPVAVYSEDGRSWILQASASGRLYLLTGATGEVAATLDLAGKVEGSPAVYQDTLVIGTTGKGTCYLYGISLLP